MKPRLVLVSIAAAVALAIAGATVIILLANQPAEEAVNSYQPPRPTATSPQRPDCPNSLSVFFLTDERMRQALPRFTNDSRFINPIAETKADNYQRFKQIFASQPELLQLTKPESLPASITFSIESWVDKDQLLSQLRQQYSPSDVNDPCALAAQLPTTPRPTR